MIKRYKHIPETNIMYFAKRAKNDINGNSRYDLSIIVLTDGGAIGRNSTVQCYSHELEYYARKMAEDMK